MNQPVGDTFHTPANLKKDVIPRRIQNYRATNQCPSKSSKISMASIFLEKPRTVSLKPLSPPSVDAHGMIPTATMERASIERKPREERPRRRGINLGFDTGSETEEEVTKFVGRVIQTAHGDVVEDLTPSKSDRDLAQYVGHVIGNVHADITNKDIEGHAAQNNKCVDLNVNNNCATGRSSAGSGRSSDESSVKKHDPDIEEIYFDDVLDSSLCQDNNMRLQSTMALDTPEYITSVFEPKALFSQKRATPADGKPRIGTPLCGDTPMYPRSAMSKSRFKFSRMVTRVTEEDDGHGSQQQTPVATTTGGSDVRERDAVLTRGYADSHDSSGTIDV